MLKKVHVISSAGAWLIVALFLGSCAPGVSFVTGVKRKSLNYEQVKVYPAPPPRYDVVGYVEGLQGRDLFMTQEKQELKALQSMRKRAAQMGANGAILTSIEYRTDLLIVYSWTVSSKPRSVPIPLCLCPHIGAPARNAPPPLIATLPARN